MAGGERARAIYSYSAAVTGAGRKDEGEEGEGWRSAHTEHGRRGVGAFDEVGTVGGGSVLPPTLSLSPALPPSPLSRPFSPLSPPPPPFSLPQCGVNLLSVWSQLVEGRVNLLSVESTR